LAGANNTGTIFEFNATTNVLTGKYSFDASSDGNDFGDVLSLVGCDKPTITSTTTGYSNLSGQQC
jgi:hypothetical protein